jgi:uncharacterized protein (TIRG00374 family)
MIIGIKNNELSNLWPALKTLSLKWIFLCLAAYCLYFLLDALTLYYFLRKQHFPVTLKYAAFIAIIGLYYADITPGASGGQPMQIYYLKKRNVPIGVSTSALAVKFFCFQFMLLILGAIAWVWNSSFVAGQLAGIRWILVVGYIFNAISVSLVLLLAVNKRLVRFILYTCIKIGHKMHMCKDVHSSTVKWDGILSSFHASVDLIRNRPKELMVQLLLSGFQVIAHMTILVCVYFAFGLTGTSIGKLITMALLLYISAAYTPLPGGSGVQEGGFLLYFKTIIPDERIFTGMLIWRFFTFYLNLLSGASASVFQGSYEFYREKRKGKALLKKTAKENTGEPGLAKKEIIHKQKSIQKQ